MQVPTGTYGLITSCIDLSLQHHIKVGAGVVDADYRSNVGVLLFNHSLEPFNVHHGDKVALLVCSKIVYPELEVLYLNLNILLQ